MSSISVDIVETGATDGGHTAIRISGAPALPADATFRIDPIDQPLQTADDLDWPTGPRRPMGVVQHEGAVDLVLGPDVLESPLLLPGTPVVISIPDTAIVRQYIWPSIPTRHRRRRHALAEGLPPAEALGGHRHLGLASISQNPAMAATGAPAFGGARRPPMHSLPRPPLSDAVRRADDVDPFGTFDAGNENNAGGQDDLNRPDIALPSSASDTVAPRPRQRPDASLRPLPPPMTSADTRLPARAVGTALAALPAAPPPAPGVARQAGAFIGGMTAAALLVFGLVRLNLLQWQSANGATTTLTPQADAALSAARSASTLRAILATSGISPRGSVALGVDGPEALALADKFLVGAGDVPRDQGEASFWLRHALSQSIDQDGMRWALTQLGTIFASPEGFEPDYAKARTLWEAAGSLGDPVALCFNATLYEFGLGVPKHKELARALYERARNAGGCKDIDKAIQRNK